MPNRTRRPLRRGAALLSVLMLCAPASALAAGCGLCAKEVTTNAELAACFLERYDAYAARDGLAVAVDLEDCPSERGVVEALSSPTAGTVAPDTRFLVTRAQLGCLKIRMEAPDVALDPYLTIPLDDCE